MDSSKPDEAAKEAVAQAAGVIADKAEELMGKPAGVVSAEEASDALSSVSALLGTHRVWERFAATR